MEQYIPKSALVAEIEKYYKEYLRKAKTFVDDANYWMGKADAYRYILEILNTIEVKEVDLEKEASGEYLERVSQLDLTKHLFELGLKAKTDKELVEEIYSHIDSIKDTADRMTSGNFMHNRAAIKFSANTIAKVLELIGLKAQKG